jgi:hypothetical protein
LLNYPDARFRTSEVARPAGMPKDRSLPHLSRHPSHRLNGQVLAQFDGP